jgi:hypothetical protein
MIQILEKQCFIVVCTFYFLYFVLYALHRYTDYDYPFGIFKLFLRRSKFHKNINKRIILESNRKCTYKLCRHVLNLPWRIHLKS